jgi:hypothetical protein
MNLPLIAGRDRMLRSSLRLDSGGQRVASWTATRRPSQKGVHGPLGGSKRNRGLSMHCANIRQVLECASPLALWFRTDRFLQPDGDEPSPPLKGRRVDASPESTDAGLVWIWTKPKSNYH